MANVVKVEVPDIGDFSDVDIIEVLVSPGDAIVAEDALITLESDKATIEIPSPQAGTVKEVLVKVNDKVSQGDVILTMELAAESAGAQTETDSDKVTDETVEVEAAPVAATKPATEGDVHAEVVVLGSGPGGYTAAFRAADLGKSVILIERYSNIGGVCLNVGCIPSKALLHTAQIITEADDMSAHGVTFGKPKIDLPKLAGFKNKVIKQLTDGLAGLAKKRKVQIVTGVGKFTSSNSIAVDNNGSISNITFDNAIIAAGSEVTRIPGFPYDDSRLMDSTGALELADVPKRMTGHRRRHHRPGNGHGLRCTGFKGFHC